MKKLFSPFKIGNLVLKNRLVRAPCFEPYCNDGIISEEFIKIHENLVDNEISMTTTGILAVSSDGIINNNQLCLQNNKKEDLIGFTDRIHEKNGFVSAQLAHLNYGDFKNYETLEWSKEELEKLKNDFIDSASLCADVGFDAIEIHWFFINQFMCQKYNNTRTDEYGGDSVENRTRFVCEILEGMRENLGDDYPIFVKFTLNPINPIDEAILSAQLMEESGASAFVTFKTIGVEDLHELYCMEEAKILQENVSVPVVYNCGVETLDEIEEIFDNGFELIQIGRPLLRDPEFVTKLLNGEEDEILECLKCNACHSFIWEDEPELKCAFKCLEDMFK